MKKVLKICSPQLGVSPNSSLGGEIYDYETLKGYTKKNIKVYVYLPKGKIYDRKLKNYYVTYSLFKHVFPPILYSLLCLPYLFRTYRKEKFDILRIHSPRFLGLAGLIFHIYHPEVPILASAVSPKPSKTLFFIEKAIYKISTKIIVQSEYMRMMLQESFNIPDKKIAVTYGGQKILSKSFSIQPAEAKLIDKSDKILLFMGVIISRKNPIFLIDVFKKTLVSVPNLKLVFIGKGKQESEIKKKVIGNKLGDKVIFIDQAYGEEKAFWFNRMNIFLMPSKDEGFGLALIEAMSIGKPAIVSNIPPFKEIIKNGEDGFTLPLNSSVWANCIVKVLTKKNLNKRISIESKRKINKLFSWKRTYDLNMEAIKEIIR